MDDGLADLACMNDEDDLADLSRTNGKTHGQLAGLSPAVSISPIEEAAP